MGLCPESLMVYYAASVPFLRRINTGDETWIQHSIPVTKKASMTRNNPHLPVPPNMKFKITPYSKKCMSNNLFGQPGCASRRCPDSSCRFPDVILLHDSVSTRPRIHVASTALPKERTGTAAILP